MHNTQKPHGHQKTSLKLPLNINRASCANRASYSSINTLCEHGLLGEGWARQRAEYQTSAAASTEAKSYSKARQLPVLPLCTEAMDISVSY
jgi:hypothetical protein